MPGRKLTWRLTLTMLRDVCQATEGTGARRRPQGAMIEATQSGTRTSRLTATTPSMHDLAERRKY